ncbi:sperm-associated antigen 5 isoform X2 [Hypomesus transpacificus]|uniref:sperm-associated antigen 5 isoform X2 n=1 Tax=Hypomesus transpacificus TaxID=137520 RepID=UPI001F07E923|nr:sperm-associated antigen 5 isoform X2 [Hypomesus transpacificus]
MSSWRGERTPLRNVENEMHLQTTASRLKSRSSSHVQYTLMKDGAAARCLAAPLSPGLSSELTCTHSPEVAEKASTMEDNHDNHVSHLCGPGDVTFKSFVCVGGEVLVSESSVLPEGSVFLDQSVLSRLPPDSEGENMFSLESSVTWSCDHHVDHPYCSAGCDVTTSRAGHLSACELSGAVGSTDVPHATDESGRANDSFSGLGDITYRSLLCAGGEVEVSEGTSLAAEMVCVPGDRSEGLICPPYHHSVHPPGFMEERDLKPSSGHTEHPYCNTEQDMAAFSTEPPSYREDSVNCPDDDALEPSEGSEKAPSARSDVTFKSFSCSGGEVEWSDSIRMGEETIPLPKDQSSNGQSQRDISINPSILLDDETVSQADHPYCHSSSDGVVSYIGHPHMMEPSVGNVSLKSAKDLEAVSCQLFPECTTQEEVICQLIPDCGDVPVSTHSSTVHAEYDDGSPCLEPGVAPLPETLLDVVRELPGFCSVADALPLSLLSPVLRATPVNRRKCDRRSVWALAQAIAQESIAEVEKILEGITSVSCVVPGNPDSLWNSITLESPGLHPQFNSTALGARSSCKPLQAPPTREKVLQDHPENVLEMEVLQDHVAPQDQNTDTLEKTVDDEQEAGEKDPSAAEPPTQEEKELDLPPVETRTDGGRTCTPPPHQMDLLPLGYSLAPGLPLQQQLKQMAHLLILASNRVGLSTPSGARLEEQSVGTSPPKLEERSSNTSGVYERKREVLVSDACSATDSLLWNLAPGSLSDLSRAELEQRLSSSLIMVEALAQQLSASRVPASLPGAPGPSSLRDKLVQTDHTELSQTVTYRELYVASLERIRDLEQEQADLQTLRLSLVNTRTCMASQSSHSEAVLSSLKQMLDEVKSDHHSLLSQHAQVRSLFERCNSSQSRMLQKTRDCLQQREEMRAQRDQALSQQQAAFSVVEQLKVSSSDRISELQNSLSSIQDLRDALTRTYPQQVALNKACVESFSSASELLRGTMSDQASLHQQLQSTRRLLQKTFPLLSSLNHKTAAAIAERDQTLMERDQTQASLQQSMSSLQESQLQNTDLQLQVTIMTSEMGVLRQQLGEEEEERAGLERKVGELSATVSSSLASYAFLEQALAGESSLLQQAQQDVKLATERVNELQARLQHSEQCVCELERALQHSEEESTELQARCCSQALQLQQQAQIHTQLCSMKDMNEFLQMESELVRQQIEESEAKQRATLHALRERNFQSEDLRKALSHATVEQQALRAELQRVSEEGRRLQAEQAEQQAQTVTNITILHHTLRQLTNQLQAALTSQEQPPVPQTAPQFEQHPPSSFVDSIMVALARGPEECHAEPPAGHNVAGSQSKGLGSKNSAFSHVPMKSSDRGEEGGEARGEEEEESVLALLVDMGTTVTELASTLALLHQHKDSQHNTIGALQGELQAQALKHTEEVFELREQVSRLTSQEEKWAAALQDRAQEEKTTMQLLTDLDGVRELLQSHRTENTELSKEVLALRRSLHQSEVEAQAMREELSKAGSQSASSMNAMDDKIRLLKEVERLRMSLVEVEEGRSRLLDRAKRHQVVHEANQRKLEKELHLLDHMIEAVRKTLLSVPDVVQNCEELRKLVEYLG